MTSFSASSSVGYTMACCHDKREAIPYQTQASILRSCDEPNAFFNPQVCREQWLATSLYQRLARWRDRALPLRVRLGGLFRRMCSSCQALNDRWGNVSRSYPTQSATRPHLSSHCPKLWRAVSPMRFVMNCLLVLPSPTPPLNRDNLNGLNRRWPGPSTDQGGARHWVLHVCVRHSACIFSYAASITIVSSPSPRATSGTATPRPRPCRSSLRTSGPISLWPLTRSRSSNASLWSSVMSLRYLCAKASKL